MFDKNKKEALNKRLDELNQKLEELDLLDTKNPISLLKKKRESKKIQKEIDKLKSQKMMPYLIGAFVLMTIIPTVLGIGLGGRGNNDHSEDMLVSQMTETSEMEEIDRSIVIPDETMTESDNDELEKEELKKLEQKKAEQESLAQELAGRESLAQEMAEQESLAQEKAEQEIMEQETAEQERLAQEKAEEERLAKEKAEQERKAQERAEEERKAQEKAEQERQAQEKAQQERDSAEVNRSSGSSGGGSSVDVPDGNIAGENMVWVPVNGGKKYHSKSSCSKMIDPVQIPLSEAIQRGYEPCKRCH